MEVAQPDRQRHALAAATAVVERYGMEVRRPAVLHDSNNTVIHLRPMPLVAKVATGPGNTSLEKELSVVQYLTTQNARIVPPTSLFPPGPYTEDGLRMTFWESWPHTPGDIPEDVAGEALRSLHSALAQYPELLPPWDRFDNVGWVLFAPDSLSALRVQDRDFLRDLYKDLSATISTFTYQVRPLHGEPHGGNLLMSSAGPRWIDFESACMGPQEWDLTMLSDEVVAQHFEKVDYQLLGVLRKMRSLCVATWCWVDPDRDPILREAGTYHLALLQGN